MFHFTGYRVSIPILFRMERLHITGARLPHSEISGSQPVCGYPKLIAAYHVLHRLLAPRHSLYALNCLIPVLEISSRRRCLIPASRVEAGPPTVAGTDFIILPYGPTPENQMQDILKRSSHSKDCKTDSVDLNCL